LKHISKFKMTSTLESLVTMTKAANLATDDEWMRLANACTFLLEKIEKSQGLDAVNVIIIHVMLESGYCVPIRDGLLRKLLIRQGLTRKDIDFVANNMR